MKENKQQGNGSSNAAHAQNYAWAATRSYECRPCRALLFREDTCSPVATTTSAGISMPTFIGRAFMACATSARPAKTAIGSDGLWHTPAIAASSAQAPQSGGGSRKSVPTVANDDCPADVRFDQYYTREDVAAHFYEVFQTYYEPKDFQMVEPSAGTGSFLRLLPPGSLGYDIDPKYRGIKTANFLTVRIQSERAGEKRIAIIGNPPFGKNGSMAVLFFNHAASQAKVIALILPRSFRKSSIENRIDRGFHLVYEETVPANAFLFRAKPFDVPAVFQIWEFRDQQRTKRHVETQHPDFEFTTADRADFAIQRVGARAGRVHHDFTMSPKSHYFIRGKVEAIMAQLDFASVTGDVSGNPSLAKSEIIALYRDWVARHRIDC